MRIAALGVTGGTGRHLIDQLLAHGHQVAALARRPDAVGPPRPGLSVHRVDVADPNTMTEAFSGADAVVSVLGVSGLLQSRKGTDVYSVGTRAILTAMPTAGVRRLLVVSSGGVEPQPNDGWFYRNVLKRHFLEPIYRDMRIMESDIVGADIDHTIVRASFLVGDRPRTDYRVKDDTPFDDDKSLSRWSLAHFLATEATAPAHVRRVVYLSN